MLLRCSILTSALALAACDSNEVVNPAPRIVNVQILAINDFHGNLDPPSGSSGIVTASASDPIAATADAGIRMTDAGTALVPTGGAAYLAAQIKQLRSANPNTLLVSAGDLTGASPLLSNLFRDEPTVLAMNKIGLDFEGVGNHDFDRGLGELLRLQNGGCSRGDCDSGTTFSGASYKYLAANVENPEKMTVFPPYQIKDVGGAKIAVIGMTLQNTPSVTVASAIQGLTFDNEVDTVNKLIPEIQKQGVSAIIVLLHQGDFQDASGTYDSCSGLNGDLAPILNGADAGRPALSSAVDVLVSAHTHQPYNCTINGRLVTSAASFGRVITKIDLTIDAAAKKVTAKKAHNIPVTRDIAPDPDVASIVAMYQTYAAPLANRVVGYITGDITANAMTAKSKSCETPLGDLIADAQLAQTANLGARVAFMNPGGIRTDLVFHAPPKMDGAVLYAEAFAVQPFSNLLVTMTLTGAQIKTALDQQFAGSAPKILQVSSNLKFSYTYDKPSNKGVVDPMSITIDNAPLDMNANYVVTMNNFLAGGGDSFAVFSSGTNRTTGGIDLDAFVAYLTMNSSPAKPIAPPPSNRIIGNACQ